jgi:hypothetical protein
MNKRLPCKVLGLGLARQIKQAEIDNQANKANCNHKTIPDSPYDSWASTIKMKHILDPTSI